MQKAAQLKVINRFGAEKLLTLDKPLFTIGRKAENDLQVGGKYNARMEAKDGSFGFDFEGVYTAMSLEDAFTFILDDQRVVQVNFRPQAEQTEVIITFDAENENSLELQKAGWQAILDNFKQYTETH